MASIPAAVEDGGGSNAADHTYRLLAVVAGVFAGQQLIGTFLPIFSGIVGREVESAMTERLLLAAGTPDSTEHLDDPELAARIQAATAVGNSYGGPSAAVEGFAAVLRTQLNGIAMLLVVATYQWWMAVVLGAAWAIARSEAVKEVEQGGRLVAFATTRSQRAVYFRELALRPEAAKEIRVFGLADWITEQFQRLWGEIFESLAAEKQQVRRPLWRRFLLLAVAQGTCLVVVLSDAADGGLGLRRLVVLIQAFLALSALCTVQTDEVWVLNGAATIPGLEAVEAELHPGPAGRPQAAGLAEEVRFEAVTYRYPGQEVAVLDGLDLAIAAGRSLAIVGANGAGKTTLIKLLTGLSHPTSGVIRADGTDLRRLDPDSWRRQFGVVFQDFVHFQLPARDNVRFGAVEHPVTAAALQDVAYRADVAEVIDRLPDGWDTVLTRQAPRGADLSGGEWQRLALARALWAVEGGAKILVLDEPTAALDVRAEAAFYNRFLDLTRGLTTVVVSHRFSTVRRADRIVVIDGGRVVEDGTHDELVARAGLYARMYEAQTGAQEEQTRA